MYCKIRVTKYSKRWDTLYTLTRYSSIFSAKYLELKKYLSAVNPIPIYRIFQYSLPKTQCMYSVHSTPVRNIETECMYTLQIIMVQLHCYIYHHGEMQIQWPQRDLFYSLNFEILFFRYCCRLTCLLGDFWVSSSTTLSQVSQGF